MTGRGTPWLILANRINETIADTLPPTLAAEAVLQSPRKVWLTEPGDVVLSAVTVPAAFLAYACEVLGFAPADVVTLTVPDATERTLAEGIRRAGLTDRLRALAAERPGMRMLPYALDRPTVRLATELGVPLHPYGPGGVSEQTLEAAYRLNTKSGFRDTAAALGIRVPDGHVCGDEDELYAAVRELSAPRHDLIVKPARSANGYGVLRLPRGPWHQVRHTLAGHLAAVLHQSSGWVVEECIAPARDVSVQAAVEPHGTQVLYDGQMRTSNAQFHGYRSPLHAPAGVREELTGMARRLGDHLAARGYLGPFSIDARLTPPGKLYAIECNLRRTGTTTLHHLARRLDPAARPGDTVWIADTRTATPAAPRDLAEGLARLRQSGLLHDPGRGRGAVLAGDPAVSGAWSYLVTAGDEAEAELLEQRLRAVLALD
ncbi:peptide ligase PGM1-related protein [Streptomyces sp. NPDC026206]|uniref:preATP grasp domain-containing protein n=1 Tax=Streptomyces sp. NPDC026206 TaxID=3157089 RepID=UPI0034090FA8